MSPWKQRLAICRRNLGSRTGEFWRENRHELEIGHEFPLDPGDELERLWRDQELLFTRGDVQVAALLHANTNLFHRAWVGAPAVVVHGPHPSFAENPDALFEIVDALEDLLRHPAPVDPQLADLRARLISGVDRTSWEELPTSIAGQVPCFLSTMFLHRGAMPDGWLAGSMFPVLALQAETPALALLPSRYWPEDLVREWRDREPSGACDDRPVLEIKGYGWPVPAFLLGSFALVQIPLELATGNRDAARDLDWPDSISFALAGLAIFLFDRRERRPSPPRYFGPSCAHPIEVHFDRRFLFLKPRTWAYVAWGFAIVGGIEAIR